MVHNRLQNKIAGSELTLPFCVVVSACLWWLPEQTFSINSLLGLVLCLLTTYIIMETNVQQRIIRLRSHLMPCVWLVLAASLPFMHPLGKPLVAAAFLCVSYVLLFCCYGRPYPQVFVFHTFFMLGIGSFFAPIMLPMAVLFFLYLIFFLRSLTKKAFWAGILGLFVPYWCYAVWYVYTDDVQGLFSFLSDMAHFDTPSIEAFTSLPLSAQVSTAVIALLSIVSIIHYLRTKYDDKIRVRMILYIYVSQTLLLLAFLLLQPARYETTMALLVASACPLIAHYFTLTGSILSNLFFLLSLVLTAAMATLNLGS